MDNKKLLRQVLKIDKKADLVHLHDEYLSKEDLPNGGYISIDIKASDWTLEADGLYHADILHQLGTSELVIEAFATDGSLLLVGIDTNGDPNLAEVSSEEAIDMTLSIIHRSEAHTAVGYNPINDEVTNNFQTWSSEKVNNTIKEITGAVDMSHLATKVEVEEDLVANLQASKDYTNQAINALPEADVTKAYVDQQLATKANLTDTSQDIAVKNITVNGSILPGVGKSSTYDIGSPTQRFKGLYVDEAYLSTNTLYIGDTPILGTNQDTIMIKADPDQSITMRTTATGTTKIISESGVEFSTSGMNANVILQATGTNSQVNISSTGATNLTAPTTNITSETTNTNALMVNGNLTVNGAKSTLQCRTVEIKDNMVDINYGETGNGVTAKTSGLRIMRGDADPFYLVFDESDDKLKVGFNSSNLKPLALSEEISTMLPEAKAYTDKSIGDLMGSAPEALNTLQELADALGNDSNFATTIATQIGTKADSATVNTELATKASTEYVNNELTKKAPVVHNHDDRYFTKDEINAMMSNLVTFEPVSSAYTLKSANEDIKPQIVVESLIEQLQKEKEARIALETKLLSLEKLITTNKK